MSGSRIKTSTKKPTSRATSKLDVNRSGSTRDEIAWASLFGIYLIAAGINRALSVFGAWYHWVVVILCILAATAIVAWRIWILMGPRRPVERENVTAAFAAAGIGASLTVVFALSLTWLIIYVILGIAAVVIFNMQESRRVKGDGRDAHTVSGLDPEALGLAPGTTMRPRGEEIIIEHKDGQTVADVRANIRAWESRFKRAAGSLVARMGKHAGQTIVRPIDPARLDKPSILVPPTPPATAAEALSIEDPIEVGTYADGTRASGVYAGHSLDMGVTGSGKSVLNQILAAHMLTRRDVCVMWCDPIAGASSAGPVVDGLTWAAEDEAEAKVMLVGLVNAVKQRIKLLHSIRDANGQKMVKWTREAWDLHRVPKLVVFCDEAEWLVDNQKVIEIVEQARKAGIELRFMLPRASHSRMDTDLRAQLARRTCFGVMDSVDAGFVLPDDVIAAGAAPEEWRDEFPGRHVTVAKGIPREKHAMPIAGDMPTRDGGKTLDLSVVTDMVRAHAHVRAQLDPVTAAALGPAYANWVSSRGGQLATGTGHAVAMPAQTPGHGDPTDAGHVTKPGDQIGDEDDDQHEPVTELEDLTVPSDEEIDLTGIDPDMDDLDDSADHVDFGDITASKLSTEERNERFHQMLVSRYESGQIAVSRTEMSNEWHDIPGGGGKPWPYMRLERLDAMGYMRQDTDDAVFYRFLSDPRTWTQAVTTYRDDGDLADAG